ncbi:fatty acyl-AMP ligase [Eleftheria terrae]|uniref:fatty acyl-AMP ligase n=1 Tax=Eleftheria terrae TaxID=1597781 RepID=UPI00263B44D7|nr:fatty acyl-AMP ligase [Eleftheria terrae]WKB51316.1 fatty acyl-AMP ligase [Eleftheria terrae]
MGRIHPEKGLSSSLCSRPAGAASHGTHNIVARLHQRALASPRHLAFRHLRDGEFDEQDCTYADLWQAACAVASEVSRRGLQGQRIMLVLEPGLPYVAALFGILLAGATVVPAFPPVGARAVRRMAAIHADCRPSLVIAGPDIRLLQRRVDAELGALGQSPRWLFLEDGQLEKGWTGPEPVPADSPIQMPAPAVLQYTSGSTGAPKGVLLSHDNIVSNCEVLEAFLDPSADRIGLSWLPPYHDMGLMGTLLLAVHSGFPLITMSPAHFVQNPLRWLRAVTRHRVSMTVAPNFALDLCADAVDELSLDSLDLASLRRVFCGAEPVTQATLQRFCGRFAPRGFSRAALLPCYGLAEATLFVAGKAGPESPSVVKVDTAALDHGFVHVTQQTAGARALVGCGTAAHGHELLIVDPQTRLRLPERMVGEIWIRGRNVGLGYFEKDAASEETFRACLADDPARRRFLRTGDLGFLCRGELFVTGRMKDVVVLAGRNLYPQDIEQSVQQSHAAIRRNGVVAFAVREDDSERLVIVAELSRRAGLQTNGALASVRQAVVESVVRDHGVAPSRVHLVPTGSIPLTTSGKVQRQACKQAFLARSLAGLDP